MSSAIDHERLKDLSNQDSAGKILSLVQKHQSSQGHTPKAKTGLN